MHPALTVVNERFPHVRDRAVQLFEHDEDFRELCEEYQACTETTTRLESSDAAPAGVRNEYAVLRLRLERELLRFLEEHPNG
jgi:hypothetical protein